MELYGPNNLTLKISEDNDSGNRLNAKITQNLEVGTYKVLVRESTSTASSKIKLELRKGL